MGMLRVLLILPVLAGYQTSPAADRPPMAVIDLRDAAVAVWRPALVGDWTTASDRLDTIDRAVTRIPAQNSRPDLLVQLHGRVKSLRRALRAHRRFVAATDANWIARIAEELAAGYETSVPADVRLLAFYGRAAETDAAAGRHQHVKADVASLRARWRTIEPTMPQREGPDLSRQFTDALVRLDAAKTPSEQKAAAESELALAERVQGLFHDDLR